MNKQCHKSRTSQKARAKAVAALKIILVSRELAESQIELRSVVSIALVPPVGETTVCPKPTE